MGLQNVQLTATSTLAQQWESTALDDRSIAACSEGNKALLEELLKNDDELTNKTDSNGRTLVHIAALNCHKEIINLLLENGADLDAQDSRGNTALHLMCERGNMIIVKHLINKGADIQAVNREQCNALHLAVASNNPIIVRLCLRYGARIDTKQEDGSTALHLACTQGALRLVEVMLKWHLEQFPKDGKEVLNSRGCLDMTPLHKAAMFDHAEVVQYLIEMGSPLDAQDSEYRTPMHLAAICPESKSLNILLEAGAKVTSTDWNDQNVLHYLASLGQPLCQKLESLCSRSECRSLLNQRDFTGCTPLHLASKSGNSQCAKTLLNLGSVVNAKDDKEQSPVHFAAEYGQLSTLRLLATVHGHCAANDRDGNGRTALHLACQKGHLELVQELLLKGALLHRDVLGQTPLHLGCHNGQIEIIKMLLSFRYCFDMKDQADINGNTALHLGALANQAECVEFLMTSGASYCENDAGNTPLDICCTQGLADTATVLVKHERRDDVLQCGSTLYKTPAFGLIECLPEVYTILLDYCHTTSNADKDYQYYFEKFTFDEPNVNISLSSLNHMVKYRRSELLSHPIHLQYLQMKWIGYGFMTFLLHMIVYALFVSSLSYIVVRLTPKINLCRLNATQNHLFAGSKWEEFHWYLLIFITIFVFANIFQEFLEMWQKGKDYYSDDFNYIEWAVFLSCLMFVIPQLYSPSACFFSFQWQCGAICQGKNQGKKFCPFGTHPVCVVLSWINLMLYLARMEAVGLYAAMFLQILKTLLRVAVMFSLLFVAFGLGFHILLFNQSSQGFDRPLIAIVDSIYMTMGEINFQDTFVESYIEGTLQHRIMSFLFLLVFTILMPVLFINLLIGLAVGDIDVIQKNAELKRFDIQTFTQRWRRGCLHRAWLNRVNKNYVMVTPNLPYHSSSVISWIIGRLAKTFGLSTGATLRAYNKKHAFDVRSDPTVEELLKTKEKLLMRMNNMENTLERHTEILQELIMHARNMDPK